jgi:hypothetical protein
MYNNTMKNEKYHTVGKVQTFNTKMVDRGKINTSSTHIHDCSLPGFGTGTSIKSGRVKLKQFPIYICGISVEFLMLLTADTKPSIAD